jgi:hypothetical protein
VKGVSYITNKVAGNKNSYTPVPTTRVKMEVVITIFIALENFSDFFNSVGIIMQSQVT